MTDHRMDDDYLEKNIEDNFYDGDYDGYEFESELCGDPACEDCYPADVFDLEENLEDNFYDGDADA